MILNNRVEEWAQENSIDPKQVWQYVFFTDYNHLSKPSHRSHLNRVINEVMANVSEISNTKHNLYGPPFKWGGPKKNPSRITSHSFRSNVLKTIVNHFGLKTAHEWAQHTSIQSTAK